MIALIRLLVLTSHVDLLHLNDSLAVYGDSFLTNVFYISNANSSSGCILFLCGYAVATLEHVNETGNVTYFLFDLHCRNGRGITVEEIAFSVLLSLKISFK